MSELKLELHFPPGEYYDARRESIDFRIDREPLNDGCVVSLIFAESVGVPARYLELTPENAKQFAQCLLQMAEAAEETATEDAR